MAMVSELFAVDVEQFMKTLQVLYSRADNLMANIENRTYRNINILYELDNLSTLVSELKRLNTLITIKVERHRPNNTALRSLLKQINGYISRLGTIFWMAKNFYQKDPNYGISGLYESLYTVRQVIEEIDDQLKIAIEKGLFI
ncbi:MAG: hypothetical protein ACO2ON_02615 [Candidatus Nanopusillus sp.]